jgi:hypothetical protein
MLLVCPSTKVQDELQKTHFPKAKEDINVYYFDKSSYNKDEIDWLLNVFQQCDVVIVDIDNCPPFIKDAVSFMIAKTKTYWLTNSHDTVYNHISKNKVYTLDFLSKIGDYFATE